MKFLKELGKYNKAFVAATMAILYFVQAYSGMELPVDEAEVSMFWMVITSFLVYLIPNTKKEEDK